LCLLFAVDCCIIIIFYPRQSLFSEHTRIQHVTIYMVSLLHRATINKSSAVAELDDLFATIDVDRKVVGGCCVPFRGRDGSPSNTMSPGPRPTSVPSGILIHPTVFTIHQQTGTQTIGPIA